MEAFIFSALGILIAGAVIIVGLTLMIAEGVRIGMRRARKDERAEAATLKETGR